MNEINETWALLYLGAIVLIFAYHWVLEGIAYQTMARRRGLRHRWLVWLPVGRDWIQGSLSDQYQYLVRGQIRSKRKVLSGLSLWGSFCFGQGSLERISGFCPSSCNTQATSFFGKSLAFPL